MAKKKLMRHFRGYDSPQEALDTVWQYLSDTKNLTMEMVDKIENAIRGNCKVEKLELALDGIFSNGCLGHMPRIKSITEDDEYLSVSTRHYEESRNHLTVG